jgi:hypothetical protein
MADRVIWLLMLACASCLAQQGGDPTRPPSLGSAGDPPAAIAAPVLQSVILPQTKGVKAIAIISGEHVELGGRYGDAQLEELSEAEAVLVGAAGRQVLRLTPKARKSSLGPQQAR